MNLKMFEKLQKREDGGGDLDGQLRLVADHGGTGTGALVRLFLIKLCT